MSDTPDTAPEPPSAAEEPPAESFDVWYARSTERIRNPPAAPEAEPPPAKVQYVTDGEDHTHVVEAEPPPEEPRRRVPYDGDDLSLSNGTDDEWEAEPPPEEPHDLPPGWKLAADGAKWWAFGPSVDGDDARKVEDAVRRRNGIAPAEPPDVPEPCSECVEKQAEIDAMEDEDEHIHVLLAGLDATDIDEALAALAALRRELQETCTRLVASEAHNVERERIICEVAADVGALGVAGVEVPGCVRVVIDRERAARKEAERRAGDAESELAVLKRVHAKHVHDAADAMREARTALVEAEHAAGAALYWQKIADENGALRKRLAEAERRAEQERAKLAQENRELERQRDEARDLAEIATNTTRDAWSEVVRLREALEREVVEFVADHGRRCRLCGGAWDRTAHPQHEPDCDLAAPTQPTPTEEPTP